MATTGNSSNSLISNGNNSVNNGHTRIAPSLAISSLFSKIHGAFSEAIAPQKVKFIIDKRTIEKTWKNMDKGKIFFFIFILLFNSFFSIY